MSGRWGPDGRRAAVSLTFDNLGEAMELSLGTWPEGRPVGDHPAVRRVLPRVLDLVAEHGLRSTYFAEGWAADVYPDALAELRARGHEIGYHGWRHEHWPALDSRAAEDDLIGRGVEAMRRHGIELAGFRPPGGALTPWTVELAREHGFAYLSPPAERAGPLAGGLVAVPFQWKAIDTYYLFDSFAPLRRQLGDPAAPLPPERMVAAMRAAVDRAVAAGSGISLLFHPFLHEDPDHFAAMSEVVAGLAANDDVWCVPAGDQAAWMLAHPGDHTDDPLLDERTWR